MASDYNKIFGEKFLINLSNEERRYLALEVLDPGWTVQHYYSKTNYWYTRVTAFFCGNNIVKVIYETKKILSDGELLVDDYCEYDTCLATEDRKLLLPLSSRGKAKSLSASRIKSVPAFGCRLSILFGAEKACHLYLDKPRANKDFPIGEWDKVSKIKSDEDFHSFMQYYISSCREDYFDKLETFKNAKKLTVKYRAGDIFRMEYDRTHYSYGIITGEVRHFLSLPELPEKHSLRNLMTVPLMLRCYRLLSDDPNIGKEQLGNIPLGRLEICSDNDIIWGNHTIVDHKELEEEDLEFNFVCTRIFSPSPYTTLFTQDGLAGDGIIKKREYTLHIEWGFAQTSLAYSELSDRLRELLENYRSPHGGVSPSISPLFAVAAESEAQPYWHKKNLLAPENREILNEIFACLGLEADTCFDSFAEKFGGIKKKDILKLISAPRKRSKAK